jgi:DNA-binding winged helix-turn-helix (wHTH) protein
MNCYGRVKGPRVEMCAGVRPAERPGAAAGNLVSRAALMKEVWGYRSGIESRTVDTHIAKLRAKIDRGERSRIVTVRKKGYRLR